MLISNTHVKCILTGISNIFNLNLFFDSFGSFLIRPARTRTRETQKSISDSNVSKLSCNI